MRCTADLIRQGGLAGQGLTGGRLEDAHVGCVFSVGHDLSPCVDSKGFGKGIQDVLDQLPQLFVILVKATGLLQSGSPVLLFSLNALIAASNHSVMLQ